MANRDTNIADLCRELGISRATLYRYVGPAGQMLDHAKRVLKVPSDTPNAVST
jgi:transposase-like protein